MNWDSIKDYLTGVLWGVLLAMLVLCGFVWGSVIDSSHRRCPALHADAPELAKAS